MVEVADLVTSTLPHSPLLLTAPSHATRMGSEQGMAGEEKGLGGFSFLNGSCTVICKAPFCFECGGTCILHTFIIHFLLVVKHNTLVNRTITGLVGA